MSFDVTICFAAAPDDLPAKWQAALRELGIQDTVHRPEDWEKGALWRLLEKPTDKPEDAFEVYIGPILQNELKRYTSDPEEQAVIAKLKYVAAISTRLSAGSAALMYAGALAKATEGVMLDPQVAAFEPLFEKDLAAIRGPRGAAGKPTLAERGFYDAQLAWAIAKAASAYEARAKEAKSAGPGSGAPGAPAEKSSGGMGWLWVTLGVLAVGGVYKLAQRKKEKKQ